MAAGVRLGTQLAQERLAELPCGTEPTVAA
jgi:hypothetical protein